VTQEHKRLVASTPDERIDIINPDIVPVPLGVEVIYYTIGGSLVRGVLTESTKHTCMGYLSFPKKPQWLKDKLAAVYNAQVFVND
jgi:hypothetical protein